LINTVIDQTSAVVLDWSAPDLRPGNIRDVLLMIPGNKWPDLLNSLALSSDSSSDLNKPREYGKKKLGYFNTNALTFLIHLLFSLIINNSIGLGFMERFAHVLDCVRRV